MKNTTTLSAAILFFNTFFLHSLSSQAQSSFERTYGGKDYEMGNWLCKTSDGGFILTGQSMSYSDKNGDIYVVKTDDAGNIQWQKHFGGSELDGGNCIIESPGGGYVVIGHTESWGNGDCEAYIMKLSAEGDSLWLRTIGDTGDDAAYSGVNTSDHSYLMSGIFQNVTTGTYQAFLSKYDSSGNLLWFKKYGNSINQTANCVLQTMDGNYVIAGQALDATTLKTNAFLLKTDVNGNELWEKTISMDSSVQILQAIETSTGDLILGGYANGENENGYDIFLLKTDALGNELWNKEIAHKGSDDARSISLADNDNFLVTGTTQSIVDTSRDIFLMKFDAAGNEMWEKYFGGAEADIGRCVIRDGEGYAITGVMTNNTDANLAFVRTNSDGSTGIAGVNANSVSIHMFPNPVVEDLIVDVNNPQHESLQVLVYDAAGKIIQARQHITNDRFSVPCSKLPPGEYMMELMNDQHELLNASGFVKQ